MDAGQCYKVMTQLRLSLFSDNMAGEDYLGLKPYSLKTTFIKPVITHFLKNLRFALLFQIQLILANTGSEFGTTIYFSQR